jgi:hypothetical protein
MSDESEDRLGRLQAQLAEQQLRLETAVANHKRFLEDLSQLIQGMRSRLTAPLPPIYIDD